MRRGRRSIAIGAQPGRCGHRVAPGGTADVLIEGFRPGVAERLGIGPEPCFVRNARLVYGRMTGYGQDGPYAREAGHDINYIALSGVLGLFGRAGDPPLPPLNLLGDYGGGGMLMAFGIVCAVLEARRSGTGQVIDAAMVDGSALLAASIHGLTASGGWQPQRGTNLLDTGAFFYDVYETADGKYMSVGAIEPQSFRHSSSARSRDDPNSPHRGIARTGPRASRSSPRRSVRKRARSGPQFSPGGTRASHRSSRSRKPPIIRTTARAQPSSSRRGSRSRHRRRASAKRPAKPAGRHREPASTPTRSCATADSIPRKSRS